MFKTVTEEDIFNFYECGVGTIIDCVSYSFLEDFGEFIASCRPQIHMDYLKEYGGDLSGFAEHCESDASMPFHDYISLLCSFLSSRNAHAAEFEKLLL